MDEWCERSDDFMNVGEHTIRAKWCMDGARSLSECAEKLRAFAVYLERMQAEGWCMDGAVGDDYGFARMNPKCEIQD